MQPMGWKDWYAHPPPELVTVCVMHRMLIGPPSNPVQGVTLRQILSASQLPRCSNCGVSFTHTASLLWAGFRHQVRPIFTRIPGEDGVEWMGKGARADEQKLNVSGRGWMCIEKMGTTR